jgi:uncharacterized membrane protein YsdA (DUF1294 family)/cold shock CspA family protein
MAGQNVRTKGRITSWNDEKGYGFITPLTGGKQVFFHISALGNRDRRPEVGEVITYSVSKDARGRPCAANATLAGDKLVAKAARKGNRVAILLAVLFMAAIGVATLGGDLSIVLLIAYVVMSFITFIAYAIDKSAAQKGRWRTAEGTLLMLGLAGGWPGGLIAQETLRHKSKKTSFRLQFWFTVFTNCAALVWLHTEGGREVALGFFS